MGCLGSEEEGSGFDSRNERKNAPDEGKEGSRKEGRIGDDGGFLVFRGSYFGAVDVRGCQRRC